MRRWLLRLVLVVVAVEVVYLAAANIVLNLPAAQSWLDNERISFRWDRARSWYPLRLDVTGLTVNGQSWAQQWEFSAPAVSGSLAILPLLSRTLRFNGVETADIAVRFRPRPRPDHDDAKLRPFYPTIPGRDPSLAADPVPTQEPGWLTEFAIARIGGSNDVWLGAMRATLVGDARATVIRQNRHGPLAVEGGVADLKVESLSIAGEQVTPGGSLGGSFGFASFIPQENRGLALLGFLTLDATIDFPVERVDFLDFLFDAVADLRLSGKGSVKGRVVFSQGDLKPGTDLALAADNVDVDLPPYGVRGTGTVAAKVDAADPQTLAAALRFETVNAHRIDGGGETLFAGNGVAIDVTRSAHVLPGDDAEEVPRSVSVVIPEVSVPDLTAYQRYLPDKWQAELLGGEGSLKGTAALSGAAADFDLTLSSSGAKLRFKDKTFETGAELVIKAKGTADDKSAAIDLAGTYLDLDDSKLTSGGKAASDPWRTRATIDQGSMEVVLPGEENAKTGAVGFWRIFMNQDLDAMLASIDGRFQGKLAVSDLDWVTLLFKNPFALVVESAAEVAVDVTLSGGALAEGSKATMPERNFTVEILDYVALGSGGFDLAVTKGGDTPDLRLNASLKNGSLRLTDEKTAVVEQVAMTATATAAGVTLKDGGELKSVEMSIPSAKVTDMSAYNVYLPAGTPIRILNGTASLSAKLAMEGDSASGFVKMKTSRIGADVVGERISGVIDLDVAIKGGSAKALDFDISGSSLTLDEVSVTGSHATGGWNARADFKKARVTWKRPMTLDLDTGFTMKDAQPLLAVFSANRKENRWLDRLLDLRNIRGDATVRLRQDQAIVPYAFATSDTIDVGAKGVFRKGSREGVFYARSGKLAAILVIDNDAKKFELIEATKKFDDYSPGGPLPGLNQGRRR